MASTQVINSPAGRAAATPVELRSSIDLVPHAKGTLLVLGGLLADQLADAPSRADVVAQVGRSNGWSTIRFNYPGHGKTHATRSGGSLSDISLTSMLNSALDVLGYFAPTTVAFVGSSIGAGLMPFLAVRAAGLGMNVVGAFGVSAVPAAALAAFIYQQLDQDARRRFDEGYPVEIKSPTLDEPFTLSRTQIADLPSFGYNGLNGRLDGASVKLLVGTKDPISTQPFNVTLAGALGGTPDSVTVLDNEGHEISYSAMERELRRWTSRL
ncbi:alpha/beta fold hydrolase [Roseateles sp. DB2]|uniref:alpha/beta fold hydrolase n=1 Tax=Roseateles sp. DB2 TaxID=3453717 RepID=UPI003EED8215